MSNGARLLPRLLVALACVLVVGPVTPVRADGGPILSDAQLWSRLAEGHQIGVVRLQDATSAQVDLFISILDDTGESHEVRFFLPLGRRPAGFAVREETTLAFDEALTSPLDALLSREARRTASHGLNIRAALFVGTLFITGGWSWPLWLLTALAGCTALNAPVPVATFETQSSRVALYDVNAATDLDALITMTGLDPAVVRTLERLRGQQIAVITLQTQAPSASGEGPSTPEAGAQPGLHLHWVAGLVPEAEGPTYHYPLSTGTAWAQPIAITRLYVVAPPGDDVSVRYPLLGADRSGYVARTFYGAYAPRILGVREPAYAVDEAVGVSGHVWRVTYLQSNPGEDVVITFHPGLTGRTRDLLRQKTYRAVARTAALPLGIIVALALWALAWRVLMPRMLGVTYSLCEARFWRDALGWALIYPATTALGTAFVLLLVMVTAGIGALVALPLLGVVALGGVGVFLFARTRSRQGIATVWRAVLAYLAVVGAANAAYLLFAAAYALVAGAL